MTSHFDSLELIFHNIEHGEMTEFRERAEELARRVKACIETKLGKKLELGKPPVDTWYHFFSRIHDNYDHTDRWHLRLISPELDRDIRKLAEEIHQKDVGKA